MTYEQDRALMEGHRNAAAESYFQARPVLDARDIRRAYEAAYAKAWEDCSTSGLGAERYRKMRAWFLSDGKRSDIAPNGHICVTTEAMVDAGIDALPPASHPQAPVARPTHARASRKLWSCKTETEWVRDRTGPGRCSKHCGNEETCPSAAVPPPEQEQPNA